MTRDAGNHCVDMDTVEQQIVLTPLGRAEVSASRLQEKEDDVVVVKVSQKMLPGGECRISPMLPIGEQIVDDIVPVDHISECTQARCDVTQCLWLMQVTKHVPQIRTVLDRQGGTAVRIPNPIQRQNLSDSRTLRKTVKASQTLEFIDRFVPPADQTKGPKHDELPMILGIEHSLSPCLALVQRQVPPLQTVAKTVRSHEDAVTNANCFVTVCCHLAARVGQLLVSQTVAKTVEASKTQFFVNFVDVPVIMQ